MRPVFLIGFMGCGKSTLGRALSERSALGFIDLDSLIEERCGMSVSRIFALHGEARFRAIERQALADVAATENVVVACGGGTPCFFDNMSLMTRSGLTVWLEASHLTLMRRLRAAAAERPLIAGKNDAELSEFIAGSLRKRAPHYSQAAARFPSDRLETLSQIDESVRLFAETFNISLK